VNEGMIFSGFAPLRPASPRFANTQRRKDAKVRD